MKRFINKLILFPLICLSLLLLYGCWDNRDITKLSIVAAVGIDKVDDGQTEITIQLVNPGIIKAIEQGSMAEPFLTISAKGYTAFEAIRNILLTVDKRPNYSHMSLIIIGETVAKEMIEDALDVFERDHETRKEVLLLVSKDISAKEVLKSKFPVGVIPAFHISETLENNKANPKIRKLTLIDFLKEFNVEGKSPVIGTIHPNKDAHEDLVENLILDGSVAFRKGKAVGWLDPLETRGYLFVIGEVDGGLISISNPLDKETKISIEMIHTKSKMDIKNEEGEILLLVDIDIKCIIGGQQASTDLTIDEDKIKKIEAEIEKVIEKEVRHVVKLAQLELRSDIFGFGHTIHRKNLSYWKEVKGNWNNEFSKLPVQINVKPQVVRSGLIKGPSKDN